MAKYQIACNWSSSLVAADRCLMKSQTASISSFAPDSKPWESWKIKLLPSYVIWCSISCMPLWQFNVISEYIYIPLPNLPQLMVSNVCQKVPALHLEGTEYEKTYWAFIPLTLLVMYNDGFCSFPYTTNLLKDGCFACIGPSYDKNAETGASVLFPEMYDILRICSCNDPVKVWMTIINFDKPDAGVSEISAITDTSTDTRTRRIIGMEGYWRLVESKG